MKPNKTIAQADKMNKVIHKKKTDRISKTDKGTRDIDESKSAMNGLTTEDKIAFIIW